MKTNPLARLERIQKLVNAQAEDAGIWFVPQTITEDYLQRELRKLHAVIEETSKEDHKITMDSEIDPIAGVKVFSGFCSCGTKWTTNAAVWECPSAKEDGIPEEPTDLQKTLTSGFKTSITITANDEAEGRRVVSGWRNEDVRQYAINWVARAEARQRLADEAIAALRAMLKPSVVASLQEPEGELEPNEYYLAKAEKFMQDAAKMDNAPVVYMVAAAFKNEDRAKVAEAELRKLRSQETPQEAWIPVEQELPQAGLEVLTMMHGYTGNPLIKQDHTTKYAGNWSPIHPCWKNDGMWFMNDREGRTTHWRNTFAPPLPYQEEKESK